MVSTISLRRYINRLNDVICIEDKETAKELQDEVIAVFGSELCGLRSKLTSYKPCMMGDMGGKIFSSSSSVDYIKDANILRSRLQAELDKLESQIGDLEENMPIMRDSIFISHRTTDVAVADMIKDFLVSTGIPNDKIFCSSLPGNDVAEKIAPEVKANLKKAIINILILSRDYYDSAYCLNEAGIAWYLDEAVVIPFGLPEIDEKTMIGFVGSDYKLRRLDKDVDIAYLFDQANDRLKGMRSVSHCVITQETKKLKERYTKYLEEKTISTTDDDDDELMDYDEDIWKDGYHIVRDGEGRVLQEGEFMDGHLIEGVEYSIVIRAAKGDEENDQPVFFEELKDEGWHYGEYGQYKGFFEIMPNSDRILEEGIQFFYVVDKRVKMIGKELKPTFTNFRTLENFLEKEEPDELDYIKTGVRKYSQTCYADIEV